MSEFDDHDLAERLRRLGGAMPDAGAAHTQLRRRVTVARRRRAAAWSGGAAVMLLAVVGAYAAGSRQGSSVQPATTGDTTATSVPTSAPTSAPTTADVGATSSPTSAASTSVPASTTLSTVGSGTTAPGTSTSVAPTTAAPPAPVTSTYSGIGGSITVRLQAGTLSLLSTQPAAGYAVTETRTEADRVEVRFHDGDRETRIRVELVGGAMQPDIRESGG